MSTTTARSAVILLAASLAAALGCAGARPDDLGLHDGRLAACPESPNCVSSAASDEEHGIAGFAFESSPEDAWDAAVAAVRALPRTEVITHTSDYLHAESTTALMRYVDDLELHLRAAEGSIAVRSASRVGHSDMGANRERVEALRTLIAEGDEPR
jgi:uncharacterized protein (DUF1499 family)